MYVCMYVCMNSFTSCIKRTNFIFLPHTILPIHLHTIIPPIQYNTLYSLILFSTTVTHKWKKKNIFPSRYRIIQKNFSLVSSVDEYTSAGKKLSLSVYIHIYKHTKKKVIINSRNLFFYRFSKSIYIHQAKG